MDSFFYTVKKFKSFFIYPSIIFLAFLTRFWQLNTLFHWSLDEEFWSFLPHNVATLEHIPLIGGHIGGTGVYSGPLFVWVFGVIFAFIRSNPFLIASVVSLIGVISTYFVIKISKLYFGSYQSYLSGFLYASSVLIVLYERKFWNASLGLILANIVLLLIDSVIKKPSFKNVTILGVVTSLAFQAHMTGLVNLIFVMAVFIIFKTPKKFVATFLLIIFFTHIPLFGFELRHDFFNTKAFVKFIQTNDSGPEQVPITTNLIEASDLIVTTFARVIFTPALDISNELTLCSQLANSRAIPQGGFKLIAILVLLYSLYLVIKNKNLFGLLIWINILLVLIYKLISPQTFYSGQSSEYYLLPSFGAFVVLMADLIVKLSQKYSSYIYTFAIFLVVINLHIIFNLTHSHNLSRKIDLLKIGLNLVGDRPYSLTVTGDECQIYGYRFLSVYLKNEPVESYVDPILGHIYQNSINKTKPEVNLIIDETTGLVKILNHKE